MISEDSTEPTSFLKFCPHCGSQSFEARTAKEFLCGACGFNFFVNSAAAVVALICDAEGRLLLTVRDREPWAGMLDLPGGFVDPGESAEEALRREVAEELGVRVVRATYLCSAPNEYVFSHYKVRTTDMAFACQVDHLPTRGTDDVRGLVWLRPEEVDLDRIPATSIRQITERFIRSAR